MVQKVDFIPINTSLVPYNFSVRLTDRTYKFTVRYNSDGYFTLDLQDSMGNYLVVGEPVIYGQQLFVAHENEKFPLPAIFPLSLTDPSVTEITFKNFGKDVKLYLYPR